MKRINAAFRSKNAYLNSKNEVAVHTLTHPFLDRLTDSEISEDRKNIEREYGVIAKGMAYPYGIYDGRIVKILKNAASAIQEQLTLQRTFNFRRIG